MNSILIDGKTHPFRRSMNALKKFDAHYKKDGVTSFTPELWTPEHIVQFVFLCIEAGYKMEDKSVPFDIERLGDLMTDQDIAQFAEATKEEAETDKKKAK